MFLGYNIDTEIKNNCKFSTLLIDFFNDDIAK